MSNKPNKYIAVSYRLYADGPDGRGMVEEATAAQPFYFISGFGIALDAFEQNLYDLQKGEDFDFTLEKEEAYGDYVQERVMDLDRSIFTIDGKFDREHIYPKAIIPLQNEDGDRFYGRVLEVGLEKVKVDLNHPLAGQTLQFVGNVIENREATNEEIQSLIARMSGGCCSGGCGSCGGDKEGCNGNCNCEGCH